MLIGLPVALSLLGLALIHSATYSSLRGGPSALVVRQAQWLLLSLCVMVVCLVVPYRRFLRAAYPIYGLSVLLLMVVLVAGVEVSGAQRWLGIGPFRMQPSELAKLGTVLALARYLGTRREEVRSLRTFLVALGLAALPLVLILVQPDLGTALVLGPIFLAMAVFAGCRPRHVLALVALGLASAPLAWNFVLRDYQKARLLVFLFPDRVDPTGKGLSWQIRQSKIAVGSGGILGKGFLRGSQSRLGFLTKSQTDFVFALLCEEMGFAGAAALLGAYMTAFARFVRAAVSARDREGMLLCVGLVVMIAVHVVVNVAMATGLAPVVGIPLPFLTSGGSSLVVTFAAFGLAANVRLRRFV